MKTKFAMSMVCIIFFILIGSPSTTFAITPDTNKRAQQSPRRLEFIGSISYGDQVGADLISEVPAHVWGFEGREGDMFNIILDSPNGDLDPFLLLLQMNDEDLDFFLSWSDPEIGSLEEATAEYGWLLGANDDREEGDTNAMIASFRLPENGRYYIVATSCCTGETTGFYELTFEPVMLVLEPNMPEEQFPDDNTPYIPRTTRIITPDMAANHLIEVAGEGETIVFAENILNDIGYPFAVNHIIALEPNEMALNGFLRKVVAIEYTYPQNEIVLTTIQASLEEAIYNGTIQATVVLSPDGAYIAESKPGLPTAKRLPAANVFTINLFEEEIMPDVTVSGEINLQPSFDIEMVIEQFDLKKLIIKNTTRQHGKLELTAETGFSNKAEIALNPLGDFAPIGVNVLDTDFTVWLTPEVTLYLGVSGRTKAAIITSANQEIFYDVSLFYEENEDLKLLVEPYGEKIWIGKPVANSQANAKAYLKPELALVVFGGTGPFMSVEGYLRFDADPCRTPWWDFYGGVSGLVGAKLKMFGLDFGKEDLEIAAQEWHLDNATTPSPVPCLAADEDSQEQYEGEDGGGGGGGLGWWVGFVAVIVVFWFLRRRS